MNIAYKILSYTPEDKMSDLICNNYPMLLVLNRFGIDLGFKDQTIAEVCAHYTIDVTTFLAIVNLLINDEKRGIDISLLSVQTLVNYLKNSHSYFLDYRLPAIRQQLQASIPTNDALSAAVINYYDEYIAEVEKHMRYEESTVFAYINDLLAGKESNAFHISIFSDHHESVEAKLSELKNIIIKYYPVATTNDLSSVLFDIFACESDLMSHNEIEDYLLTPAIRRIEQNQKGEL